MLHAYLQKNCSYFLLENVREHFGEENSFTIHKWVQFILN